MNNLSTETWWGRFVGVCVVLATQLTLFCIKSTCVYRSPANQISEMIFGEMHRLYDNRGGTGVDLVGEGGGAYPKPVSPARR